MDNKKITLKQTVTDKDGNQQIKTISTYTDEAILASETNINEKISANTAEIENLKASVNTGTFDPTSDNPAGQKSTYNAIIPVTLEKLDQSIQDTIASHGAQIENLEDNIGIVGVMKFTVPANSSHSSNEDRLNVKLVANKKYYVNIIATYSVYTQLWLKYVDGTNVMIATNPKSFTPSKDVESVGLYVGSVANDTVINCEISNFDKSLTERLSKLETEDEDKAFYFLNFYVEQSKTHSSNDDRVTTNIKEGDTIYVNIDGNTDCMYELWGAINGINTRLGRIYDGSILTANDDITSIGMYVSASSSENHVRIVLSLVNVLPINEKTIDFHTINSNYRDEYLEYYTKAKEFNSHIGDGDSEQLLFFTDAHLMVGSFSSFYQKFSLTLSKIQHFSNSVPCNFVLCGGDWLTNNDESEEAKVKLSVLDGTCRYLFKNFKPIIGNHDTNYQGAERISDGVLGNILFHDEGSKAYYDFLGQTTRFYVLDTQTDWDNTMNAYKWNQISWLANHLIEDTEQHKAIALHIWWYGSDFTDSGLSVFANNIKSLVIAYNSKTSITLNSVIYDFTNSIGHIEFIVSGHTHHDVNGIVGNIPVFSTINVQNSNDVSFDMVCADYSLRRLYLVRVGIGDNRTFNLDTGELIS